MKKKRRKAFNGVNGGCLNTKGTSTGRGQVETMGPPQPSSCDHQQKMKKLKKKQNKIKIATWNAKTLYQKGKLDNVIQEMERMKINMLGIAEMRWKGNGCSNKEGKKNFLGIGKTRRWSWYHT